MGTAEAPEGPDRDELLAELEEIVKDSILEGGTKDKVLTWLINITRTALQEEQPLFPDILKRPTFYEKFFRRWVAEGIEDEKTIEETRQSLVTSPK